MDLYASFKAMPPLHKLFVLIAIATIFCSIATDCVLCKHWPLSVSASWKNPFETFDDGGMKLVFYGTEWCGHCAKLKPEWAKVVAAYAGTPLAVSYVDCDKNPDEAKAMGVTGYPSLFFIKGANKTAYTGDRTAVAIKAWADGLMAS